jgi:hypothetical protein
MREKAMTLADVSLWYALVVAVGMGVAGHLVLERGTHGSEVALKIEAPFG